LEHVEVDRAEIQAVVQHQALRDVPHLRQRIETRWHGIKTILCRKVWTGVAQFLITMVSTVVFDLTSPSSSAL